PSSELLSVDRHFRTGQEVINYLQQNYLPEAKSTEIEQLCTAYPQDPRQGSPFDTGYLNAISHQYKRLAAVQGDLAFQAPRRFFTGKRADKQPIWSFCKFSVFYRV